MVVIIYTQPPWDYSDSFKVIWIDETLEKKIMRIFSVQYFYNLLMTKSVETFAAALIHEIFFQKIIDMTVEIIETSFKWFVSSSPSVRKGSNLKYYLNHKFHLSVLGLFQNYKHRRLNSLQLVFHSIWGLIIELSSLIWDVDWIY